MANVWENQNGTPAYDRSTWIHRQVALITLFSKWRTTPLYSSPRHSAVVYTFGSSWVFASPFLSRFIIFSCVFRPCMNLWIQITLVLKTWKCFEIRPIAQLGTDYNSPSSVCLFMPLPAVAIFSRFQDLPGILILLHLHYFYLAQEFRLLYTKTPHLWSLTRWSSLTATLYRLHREKSVPLNSDDVYVTSQRRLKLRLSIWRTYTIILFCCHLCLQLASQELYLQ